MRSGKGTVLSVCHCNVDKGDTGKEETSLYIDLHVIGTRLREGGRLDLVTYVSSDFKLLFVGAEMV